MNKKLDKYKRKIIGRHHWRHEQMVGRGIPELPGWSLTATDGHVAIGEPTKPTKNEAIPSDIGWTEEDNLLIATPAFRKALKRIKIVCMEGTTKDETFHILVGHDKQWQRAPARDRIW